MACDKMTYVTTVPVDSEQMQAFRAAACQACPCTSHSLRPHAWQQQALQAPVPRGSGRTHNQHITLCTSSANRVAHPKAAHVGTLLHSRGVLALAIAVVLVGSLVVAPAALAAGNGSSRGGALSLVKGEIWGWHHQAQLA